MEKIFEIGIQEEIVKSIAETISVSIEDANKVFVFLKNSCIEGSTQFGSIILNTPFSESLIYDNGKYYINVSKGLLVIIAFLLDITLTNGIISTLSGMLGLDSQVFYKFKQTNGEVCVLREYMRKESFDTSIYSYLYGRECINNDLICAYRNYNGYCCIKESEIKQILDLFKKINLLNW